MTKRVSLTLDMHPHEFRARRSKFVASLAKLLRVPREEIAIVSINDGCTNLEIDIPDDAEELFYQAKTDHADLPEGVKEEAERFRTEYSVNPLVQRPPRIAEKSLVAERRTRNSISWLHISDAHFETSESGTRRDFWAQDKVRETFVDELPRMLSAEGIQPDFVFFTGDVAFSGKQQEYAIALHFLEALQRSIPHGKEARFVCIPGNHDVDRSVVTRFHREETEAAKFLDGHKRVMEYLGSPKHADDRERIFRRLADFDTFTAQCQRFRQPPLKYGYFFTEVFECRQLRIGVAGFNSAWRCSGDGDRGRLVVGVPQIDRALKDVSGTDLAIGLMHHPPGSDWFIDDDKIYQRDRFEELDFVLHGHEHDPTERFVESHGVISAGALYTREQRPQSVNALELDLDSNAARIVFWRLAEKRFRWVKDVDLCDDGERRFLFSRPSTGAKTRSPRRRP